MEHRAIFGMTRSGKSWHGEGIALAHPGPVIYVNPQGKPMQRGDWTRVTPHDSLAGLFRYLKADKRARVEFVPSWQREPMREQLRVIVEQAMEREWHPPLLFVFDEFDRVAPEGTHDTAVHEVAQRGGKCEVWGLNISQHPSIVSKTIVRQCTEKRIFLVEDSAKYLTSHSMPGEQIETILATSPQYSYLVWRQRKLLGPFKD